MTTVSELQVRVAASYERLQPRTWPDPHPAMTSPRDEEYSRLTDPGRYRIVHARARAWATVLEDALGVRSEVLAPGPAVVAGADAFVAASASSPASLRPCPCSSSSATFPRSRVERLSPS